MVIGTVLVILLKRRLMDAFMKRIVKRTSRGLQVTWNRLKGMRLIQPLKLLEELFLRSFLR